MEKMTQRDYFNAIIAMAKGEPAQVSADEIVTFAEGRIDALNKKSANRKPTAKQTENEAVRAAVVEFINDNAEGDGFTCSDLIKSCPAVEGKSNQYVSAILRQAVLAGEISKGTVKRRTYFAPVGVYATAEDEGE